MQYVVCKMMPSINTANVAGVFSDAQHAQQFAQLYSITDPEHQYVVYSLARTFEQGQPVVS